MGDTVRILVLETWVAIPGLTLGQTYSFQNTTDRPVYLRQQATLPDDGDTGFKLESSIFTSIVKEANDIYIRGSGAGGVVFYNDIT